MSESESEASRKDLMDEIVEATGCHDFCGYDACEIRRAREDGLHLYAAKHLFDCTGSDKVRELLRRIDPDGKAIDAEWDAFAEKEREREHADDGPAPSECLKSKPELMIVRIEATIASHEPGGVELRVQRLLDFGTVRPAFSDAGLDLKSIRVIE